MTDAITARRRNAALAERRVALGLSHEKLAYKIRAEAQACNETVGRLDSVTRHVKRIEAGDIAAPSAVYKRLIARALNCAATELFGEPADDVPRGEIFAVTSHKFVPAFVGADKIDRVIDAFHLTPDDTQAELGAWAETVDHPRGMATLHLYPWGVALLHLVEPLELPSITELARWRMASYPLEMGWLGQQLSTTLHRTTDASYVFSAYWLKRGIWPDAQLETAVRLLCMPRTLLGEDPPDQTAGAEQCETALLRGGFNDPGIASFGVPGTSLGAASWSSVVYHPLAASRSLQPADIIGVELLIQAVWCYARTICAETEAGRQPAIRADFGTRFLRGMRSRCVTAGALESSARRSMRETIVHTSRLAEQLDAAMAALRDI